MQRRRFNLLRSDVLLTLWLIPLIATADYFPMPGQVPLRRSLPTGIDLMESGLYWWRDMTSLYAAPDPATMVGLMEDRAARFFDLSYMAYLIGGPEYTRLDILHRSHFQNRVRDRLFEALAGEMGLYDRRMPRFRPLWPVATSRYTWQAGGLLYRDGQTIYLYYHFYLTPRGWRIYDVSSNGASLVAELQQRYLARRFDR